MRYLRAMLALSAFAGACFGQQTPTAPATPKPLSRDMMYRMLFKEIAAFQAEADRRLAAGKSDVVVRNYHQKLFELDSTHAAQLTQTALPCVQQMQAFDQQAAAIIAPIKQKYKGAPKGPNAMVPPPPPELAQLDAQRKAAVLAAADSLAAGFGPAQFAYFESLARRYIISKITSTTTLPTSPLQKAQVR